MLTGSCALGYDCLHKHFPKTVIISHTPVIPFFQWHCQFCNWQRLLWSKCLPCTDVVATCKFISITLVLCTYIIAWASITSSQPRCLQHVWIREETEGEWRGRRRGSHGRGDEVTCCVDGAVCFVDKVVCFVDVLRHSLWNLIYALKVWCGLWYSVCLWCGLCILFVWYCDWIR